MRDPIILGDINIPWNKEDNMDRESLVEIISLYNLKQHVDISDTQTGKHTRLDHVKGNSTTISGIYAGDYL